MSSFVLTDKLPRTFDNIVEDANTVALLGVAVGVAFGRVVVAIPIIDELSIPIGTLLVYVVVATLAGLLAASFPARRAAKLNVLDAISYE